MKTPMGTKAAAGLFALALVFAGCGDDDGSDSGAETTEDPADAVDGAAADDGEGAMDEEEADAG